MPPSNEKQLEKINKTLEATNRALTKMVVVQQETQKTLVDIGRILKEKEDQEDDRNGSST